MPLAARAPALVLATAPLAPTAPDSSCRPLIGFFGGNMLPSQASHLRGCILYFFLFMAHGSVQAFLPLIWVDKGFSDHEVGFLASIRPLVSLFVAPAVCALADKKRKQQQALYVLLALYAITRPSVLIAGTVLAVAASEASASISATPLASLVDAAVRRSFGAGGYGRQRTWGALGYGMASFLGGIVYDAGSGSYEGVMVVFVVVTVAALVAATGVPVGTDVEVAGYQKATDHSEEPHGGDGDGSIQELETGRKEDAGNDKTSGTGVTAVDADTGTDTDTTAATTITSCDSRRHIDGSNPGVRTVVENGDTEEGANGRRDTETLPPPHSDQEEGRMLPAVWAMLSTARTASFFMAVVLSGMGAGVIDTFLFVRLAELGGSNKLIGLARLVMCLAEVPFFYMSGALIDRIGTRSVAGLAQAAYAARFLYYSVLQEPWWVLPAEVLHGLTFAAMWAATVAYAQEISPARSQTTVLGLVAGLHRGMGVGLGSILGGYLYAGLGASLCFRVSAALPSISLLLLALPTVQSWLSCGRNQWKEETGERGLEGWGDGEPPKLAPEFEANGRIDRTDERDVGDVVG